MHTGVTATPEHARYAEQCTFPARHLYEADNLFVGQKMVHLDTVANTWMRAPGESIGTFALESALDELAYALEIDPIELRRLNEPDDRPDQGDAVLEPRSRRGVRARGGAIRLDRRQYRAALAARRRLAGRPGRGDGVLSRLSIPRQRRASC